MPEVVTAEEAAALVKSGMWLDYGFGATQTEAFDKALASRVHELSGVKVRSCLTTRPRAFQEADPEGAHMLSASWHFSGYDRRQFDAGRCTYVPLNLGEWPDLYRRFVERVDIAVFQVCQKDADGNYNFSISASYLRSLVEKADVVIVEVNPALPYSFGPDNAVHESEVDFVIEVPALPAPELPSATSSEVDLAIARLVAAEIRDGDCLQLGIGGLPNAVGRAIAEAGVKDLGVHTEMMVEGLVELVKTGAANGARKQIDVEQAVYAFAIGTADIYAALDRNPAFMARQVDYTNLPRTVARNDNVFSVNSTGQMDLQGQAASEADGYRHFSGTGGQLGFVRAAYESEGGRGFLCMPSTYEKHGVRKSRVVAGLAPGTIVTVPRTDVMYVATEYGMVCLKGLPVAERAKAMISIAHPDFREELEREAYANGLIPKHYF
ncbi:acetyl-CoA hydrolase/transferase C-terminal domain-containing protein [Novosphingobium sp.]|uniref:acetyl-CoA hydrolase/transferase family protein n=1 Tax=Novosphingobium sp. TaxID=1874826 RepID=UPI001D54131A|nr:acetyl-CoA hydrolase/transferase C-terminal domain-containing protein [Novosphingobium sp.]MBX9662426.1 4-hydroxybutyrate CoA-transferase [Novosphingobium sp.]